MASETTGTGYEGAPGTALVEQCCVACGRVLLDAASLAAQMGPDCREKYGVHVTISEEKRAEANQAIYRLASKEHGGKDAPELLLRLRAIGFTALADRVEQRLVKVTISITSGAGAMLRVKTPASATWSSAAERILGYRRLEEQGEGGGKVLVDYVPNRGVPIRAMHLALSRCFEGVLARSPKGLFVIGSEQETRALVERVPETSVYLHRAA